MKISRQSYHIQYKQYSLITQDNNIIHEADKEQWS